MTIGADLTPVQWHALAIAAKDAGKHRDELEPSDSGPVDFIVHVTGEVVVAEDSQRAAIKRPKDSELLAAVLGTYGPIKRERIVDEIIAEYREGVEVDPAAADAAKRLAAGLSERSMVDRRGAVTGKVDVTVS
ncbi:MAG: hypothetical protein AAGC97_03600 [Planctomycetota bacterium]